MNKSVLIFLSLLTSLLLSPVTQIGATEILPNHAKKMSLFNLSEQQWKNRVLLVFAPSENHKAYQQQMQLFLEHKAGFADRDLVLVKVLAVGNNYVNERQIDESSTAKLRDRFGIGKEDFRVILVGKDGGVKRRDNAPVEAKAIFDEIDAMPMRQHEMQQRDRN
ncbi:DUF4174 domain-containing protein [Chlorogloeopsis fritschii PCC 9212]|uniref:DUF4174 domain-containing protein n=1 Tax=Chlorogloeopsis fritschii PCC 6912 TaxID=211165 RepID=A0A3S0ZSE2_CHLFR|nr:DUF4174 domain-containing protein [Chlorogloeopsis fritschii]RUR78708.1 hypothetical protein PCC6912_34730 [Chlorogloeopsis fritschii PCC 6912]